MSIFDVIFDRNNLSHLRLSNIHKSVTRTTLYEVLFHLALECCRDVYSPPTSKRRERMVVRTRSVILSQFSVVFSWKSTGEVAGWRAKCKRIAQTAPDINAQSCTVGSLATSGAPRLRLWYIASSPCSQYVAEHVVRMDLTLSCPQSRRAFSSFVICKRIHVVIKRS